MIDSLEKEAGNGGDGGEDVRYKVIWAGRHGEVGFGLLGFGEFAHDVFVSVDTGCRDGIMLLRRNMVLRSGLLSGKREIGT